MDRNGAAATQTAPIVGRLVALDTDTGPIVWVDPALTDIPARACVSLSPEDVGRDVVLLFERGDRTKPIVMGVLQQPGEPRAIMLKANERLTLCCGEASVTLHQGKIIVRGVHVVTHASGVNRIRGGSVQIN
jgi:hypothetical protein